jgi:hypothetical protein
VSGCSTLGLAGKRSSKDPSQQQSQKTETLDDGVSVKESLQGLDLDAFAGRGFLGGSDYERYRLRDGQLWRECGLIIAKGRGGKLQQRRALQGDEVFPHDPNLTVAERRVDLLTAEQAEALTDALDNWFPEVAPSRGKTPLPGSVLSLSEPGVFELGVRRNGDKARLVTSVDAVSDRTDNLKVLSRTNSLMEILRGIGPEICRNKSFFGIGRKTF